MRLTQTNLKPDVSKRLDGLGPEELQLFVSVLERVSSVIDPNELTEDDLLGLLDQIDTPKPPSVTEMLATLNEEELGKMAEASPTTTDKYLVQAELLSRQGLLEEPRTTDKWPIDYDKVYAWRQRELMLYRQDPAYFEQRRAFYASGVDGCVAFINHWFDTHDPRNAGLRDENGKRLPVTLPLIMFPRQEQMVRFFFACMEGEADGLIEKSRDMGATWVCIAIAVWMWLFWDAVTFGFGSATAVKLDRSGDAGSIFYKVRDTIKGLPECFRPKGLIPKAHLLDKRAYNPATGAGIVGEVGDEVGRGSRTRVYVVDEAAHFEHPESVTAALSDTTRVRIDVSSVSGLGTVFHRMRQGGLVWEPGQDVVQDRTNVFIMDWRHHPAKTKEWYLRREAKFAADGLSHVFAREVDRDYSASMLGTIIAKKWLEACVDVHLAVGDVEEWENGPWFAGQDVADGGFDTNAFVARKGWVVKRVDQWGERDVGRTTRRMLALVTTEPTMLPITIFYDSIGVGAGVKSESNRLQDDNLFPEGVTLLPWNAGSKVQWPGRNVIPDDRQSPKNKEYFYNLKAQGWWDLRMRVYRTFKFVTEGEQHPVEEMISFDSKAIGKLLYKLIEELAQPTATPNTLMKLVVDKTPDGASSPNLGDACVECCFPLRDGLTDKVSLSQPFLVQTGHSCLQCGNRDTRDMGAGRIQCFACGYIGDRELRREQQTVDVVPSRQPATPAVGITQQVPRAQPRPMGAKRVAIGFIPSRR